MQHNEPNGQPAAYKGVLTTTTQKTLPDTGRLHQNEQNPKQDVSMAA